MTLWQRVAGHIAALIISMLGFLMLNVGYEVMFPACVDCHAHMGVPFAYLDGGGFDGGGGLLWSGVVADSLVILATASGLTVAFRRLFSHKRV